ESAAPDDDALAGQVGGLVPGLRVDDGLAALAAGDDERLVRGGDLEAHLGVDEADDDEGDEGNDRHDDDQGGAGEFHGAPMQVSGTAVRSRRRRALPAGTGAHRSAGTATLPTSASTAVVFHGTARTVSGNEPTAAAPFLPCPVQLRRFLPVGLPLPC